MEGQVTRDIDGEVRIDAEIDIVKVRMNVRDIAYSIGFGVTDVTRIVTASSELSRNIYKFAGKGVMMWRMLKSDGGKGIELVFMDKGPGIPDIAMAMEVGFTTSDGMGLGLPGAKRLMDEMDIQSEAGKGTVVTVKKWLRKI